MKQQRTAASIYHDLEKNLYYRIDKNTGQVIRAYKNGSPLKHFQANITGNNYKKRIENQKKSQDVFAKKYISNFRQDRLKPISSLHSFIRNYPHQIENSNKNRIGRNKEHSKSQSSFRVKSQMSENKEHIITLNEKQQSTIKKNKSNLGPLLQQFANINTRKVYENHTNLKRNSRITGNSMKKIQSLGLRQTMNAVFRPMKLVQDKCKSKNIIKEGYQQNRKYMSNQLSKQKRLFLHFHPKFEERQNIRLLNEQIQRKKNIKKLQQLFLEQTSKITSKIYT